MAYCAIIEAVMCRGSAYGLVWEMSVTMFGPLNGGYWMTSAATVSVAAVRTVNALQSEIDRQEK